jgi:hypothetical protein
MKDKHVVALDKIDSWDHFEIAMTKWNFFLQMSCLQDYCKTWKMAQCVKKNGDQLLEISRIFLTICQEHDTNNKN